METFKTLELWYSAAWPFFVSRLSLRNLKNCALILFHRNRGIVHIQGFFILRFIFLPEFPGISTHSVGSSISVFTETESNNGFSRRRKEKMNDEAAANLHDQTRKGVT